VGLFDWLTKKSVTNKAKTRPISSDPNGNNSDHDEIRELLKKATAQANEKHFDTAIESLFRAYKLMETCSTVWGIKTYFRLARYHHLAGRYDEALKWLQQLYDNVDANANAREALYKKYSWRQEDGGFAKISKATRDTERDIILAEIDLLNRRQRKMKAKSKKLS